MKTTSDTDDPGTYESRPLGLVRGSLLALAFGGVFGLGMTAQKASGSVAMEQPGWQSLDPALVAEARTAEYEQIRDRMRLSFHKELQESRSEEKTRRQLEAGGDSIAEQGENRAPQANPELQDQNESGGEPVFSVDDSLGEGLLATADKIAPEDTGESAISSAPRHEKLAAALARVLGEDVPAWAVQSPPPPEKAATPSVRETPLSSTAAVLPQGRFVIQVASFPSRDRALTVKQALEDKGYPVRVERAEIVDRGLVFRVQVPGFKTHGDADGGRARIHETTGMKGIIIKE